MAHGVSSSVGRAIGPSPPANTGGNASEAAGSGVSTIVHSVALSDRSRSAPATPRGGTKALAARLARAPAFWLVTIVGASAVVRACIGLGVPSPWILPDEVVYSDIAKSIAQGNRPAVRGVPVFGWGEVYPTLIAPIWMAFHNAYWAYHATLVVNALLMSLTAVPAYLLARVFSVSRRGALAVAGLTILVPSMSYTGAVMTENAFYPAILFAVLVIARAVRRPTPSNQVLALVLIGVVVFTRIQGVALLGAYAGALMTYALTSPPGSRWPYLRLFLPTVAVVAPLAIAPVILSILHGDGLFGWLGARSGTFAGFRPEEVPQWFVLLTADLILYVAVIPAIASTIMVGIGLSRRSPEALRLFAAVVLSTCVAMLLVVSLVSASFDVDGIGNLNERYVFYVVPLSFLGLAIWIESGLPRQRPWSWLVVAACCLFPAVIPIDRLDYNAGLQALALLPWGTLSLSSQAVALLVALLALAFAVCWLVTRVRAAGLWLIPAAWMVILSIFAVESNALSAAGTATSFHARPATWVEAAVPPGTTVPVLWDQRRARHGIGEWFYGWVMVTEFFNRNVGPVYRIGAPTYFEDFLPTIPVYAGVDGTLRQDRVPLRSRYLLVTCRTKVHGRPVARAPRGGLLLLKLEGPIRLTGERGCTRSHP